MENYIIDCPLITENNKSFLLKMNSVLKYASFFINSYNQETNTKRSLDDCFSQKMDELFEGNNYIEQAACIIDWPMCLGAKLLDCAIFG
nr:hypothetical protein [uncultured Marinifilum sp.]